MLGRLAPRSLTRADQEHLVAQVGDLGADAAVCCVRAGLAGHAVELFEQGRGVLLGQALDTRADVTVLAEQHPDVATRFVSLRDELDSVGEFAGTGYPTPLPVAPGDPLTIESAGAIRSEGRRRQTAAAAFDGLVKEIRELPGFGGFLRPSPVADLQAATDGDPVVVVAVSSFGSYALIVTGDAIEVVPLAGLTPETVTDRVIAFTEAFAATTPGATLEQRLEDTLGWLWDSIAGPVLTRLGITGPPAAGEPWPRLWWCTSGLLAFLPIHAAGQSASRFGPSPATVIDRVISSYTPTIRALAYARRTGPPRDGEPEGDGYDRVGVGDGRLLAVAMPATPGEADLPGAGDEVEALRKRFGSRVDVLTGPDATRRAVLDVLPGARWAHFACHGTAELSDPSNSRLLLADHQTRPLTVVEVARLRLHDAELAFLSACETARPGARLTDEAIHLASAFQLAGYRHVIATLWPVGDRPAVEIAADIYARVDATGDVAGAVHAATRDLRRRWPGRPSVWASHVHAGA
ncbi:CHAT domain-containing protein [Frankia sp. AiPs1]|nr:CHAT domain-containing protein [Frankia sp. AiPs1]